MSFNRSVLNTFRFNASPLDQSEFRVVLIGMQFNASALVQTLNVSRKQIGASSLVGNASVSASKAYRLAGILVNLSSKENISFISSRKQIGCGTYVCNAFTIVTPYLFEPAKFKHNASLYIKKGFHVGDCIEFDLTIKDACDNPVDVSTADTINIIFEKPDGCSLVVTPIFPFEGLGGTDGKIQYTTTTTDLCLAGFWRYQAYVFIGGKQIYSDVNKFRVWPNLPV